MTILGSPTFIYKQRKIDILSYQYVPYYLEYVISKNIYVWIVVIDDFIYRKFLFEQ